jgi:hypothetical protein
VNTPLPKEFTHEIIDGASGPCKAYRGHVAAFTTFNGIPVILMAATRSALVDAIKEINPQERIDPSLFLKATVIHDSYIKRKDEEL